MKVSETLPEGTDDVDVTTMESNDPNTPPEAVLNIFNTVDLHLEIFAGVEDEIMDADEKPPMNVPRLSVDDSTGSSSTPPYMPRRSSSIAVSEDTLVRQSSDRQLSITVPSPSGPSFAPDPDEIKLYERVYEHKQPLEQCEDIQRLIGKSPDGKWCAVWIITAGLGGTAVRAFNGEKRNLSALAVVTRERDAVAEDKGSAMNVTPSPKPSSSFRSSFYGDSGSLQNLTSNIILDRFVQGDPFELECDNEDKPPPVPAKSPMLSHGRTLMRTLSRKASAKPSISEAAPIHPLRRVLRRSMIIQGALSLRVSNNWTSLLENTMLISVELSNDNGAEHTFRLENVKLRIANAAVNIYGLCFEDSISLKPGEAFSLLFHVKLLEDSLGMSLGEMGSRLGLNGDLLSPGGTPYTITSRPVTIAVHGAPVLSMSGESMESTTGFTEWRFPLDVSDQEKRRVQEMFRSGSGSRSTIVFPLPPGKMEAMQAAAVLAQTAAPNLRRPTLRSDDRSPSVSGGPRPSVAGLAVDDGSDSGRRSSTISLRRPSMLAPPRRAHASTVIAQVQPVAEPSFGGGVVVSFSSTEF